MSNKRLSVTDMDATPIPGLGDTRTWFTFSGIYEYDGQSYLWQLTSTNVVYEARHVDHWGDGQPPRNDKTTWVRVSKDFYAEVDKAYFANPKVEKMRDGN